MNQLWLRTQDYSQIILITRICAQMISSKKYILSGYAVDGRYIQLGNFTNDKKIKKVMQEIWYCIEDKVISYTIPYDEELPDGE